MAAGASITIRNLDKLKKIAEKHPAVAKKELGTAIQRALTRIWGAEKQEAPFGVSGELRDRWTIKSAPFEGRLTAGTRYALFVHEGTAPHWPPAEYIEPWAKKHGIPTFLVQRAIARKGTKANPFLKRAVQMSESGVNREFDAALHRIVDILTK